MHHNGGGTFRIRVTGLKVYMDGSRILFRGRLFQVATNKEATIADMLADTNSRNTWKWTWFQHLFSWEEKLLEDLITKLQGVIVQLVKHLQRSSPLPGDCS
ncbi:hypothetical protein JHK82_013203 [Glycine max]|nr:hypothetical protein JHK87_013125 [Glycine soja]KAG5041099.1 hypothetical protein JHK85_013575 [Glycine max]KAG5058237.1 hypothetical protein JHK86_013233 [Glycine max]KAG5155234.1 hypothetical protein JHK82_013203 [Glycine max]KHN06506.1 hypothetical protein glysoja_010850 [Glycine soja]